MGLVIIHIHMVHLCIYINIDGYIYNVRRPRPWLDHELVILYCGPNANINITGWPEQITENGVG